MTPQSAKQKGRKFQQEVRDKFLEYAPELEPDDVRSTSMGASGMDILFSPAAARVWPFDVECKHVEKLSISKAIAQAKENTKEGRIPLVVFKNKITQREAFAVIPFEVLLELMKGKR